MRWRDRRREGRRHQPVNNASIPEPEDPIEEYGRRMREDPGLAAAHDQLTARRREAVMTEARASGPAAGAALADFLPTHEDVLRRFPEILRGGGPSDEEVHAWIRERRGG